MNHRNRKMTKKSAICWILAVVMMLTSISVSAAEFSDSAENSQENVFSSGGDGEYTEPEVTEAPLPDDNRESEEEEVISEETEQITEETVAETFVTEETAPDESITEETAEEVLPETEEETETISFEEEEVMTASAPAAGTKLEIRFVNSAGTSYYQDLTISTKVGATIRLPFVPGYESAEGSGWKWDKNILDDDAVLLRAGESYVLSTADEIMNYVKDGRLTLYAVNGMEKFTVTFLSPNGSSSSAYESRNMTVINGSKVKLPSVPAVTGYTSLGWSTRKNASTALYKPGGYLTITKNTTLYAAMKSVGTFKVVFNNNSGTSTSDVYKALSKKVTKNQYLTLPAVPKASGYVNLGWTTTKKGKKPLYKAGSRVKITKNTRFYAVRRKTRTYTVTFYLGNGSSNDSYKALKKTVKEGTRITLPAVPKRKGYVNLGWTTKKNGKTVTKRAGVSGKVTKNLKFYAVQKQAITVTLYKNNGKVWKKISMGKGDSLKLPGVKNASSYTMLGWSTKKGQKTNPTYEVGMTIRKVDKPLKLYAVVYNRSAEKNYTADEMAQADLRKYKEIIFVGDSRILRMGQTLNTMSSVTNGVTFIAHEDAGLSWLQNEGYKSLMNRVGNGTSSAAAKKTAVIFNLGINDLSNVNNYVTYMKNLGTELQKRGCTLFYMSVNPVNDEMIRAAGKVSRPEESVRSFNSVIQRSLCSGTDAKYRYLDIYSYLIKNGYSTDSGAYGQNSGVDDGLHYTTKTYKRIYNQTLGML